MEWILESLIIVLQAATIGIVWRDHRGRLPRRPRENRVPPRVPTR